MLVYVMCALSCVIAYLLCGIPSAYVIGRAFYHVDIRTLGSGNVGSTNAARTLGAKAGILTLACDILKAAVAVFIGKLLVGCVGAGSFDATWPAQTFDWCAALVYLFALLGHIFTPFLRFHGGKGIACGFGGAVVLMPWAGLCLWGPFLLFALTTRRVSAGSIAGAISLPILAYVFYKPSAAFLFIVLVAAVLVLWSHRSNIMKLIRGEESAFSIKKSK
jgi:acyl phosphate:glycerol-3-phosphate acyltransferase